MYIYISMYIMSITPKYIIHLKSFKNLTFPSTISGPWNLLQLFATQLSAVDATDFNGIGTIGIHEKKPQEKSLPKWVGEWFFWWKSYTFDSDIWPCFFWCFSSTSIEGWYCSLFKACHVFLLVDPVKDPGCFDWKPTLAMFPIIRVWRLGWDGNFPKIGW